MSEFRIRVAVDPSGAAVGVRQVKGQLTGLEKQASTAAQSIKRAFLGIGAALGARKVIELGDAYTGLQNRLRVVTKGTADMQQATEKLFAIANTTRSSVDTTAEAFTRFSLALRDTDASQTEVLRLTESVNKAIILSGASTAEASAGMIQFSQGLASGALRGDELRSVLEQLPAVADVIAKQLKVTRGQLRDMGKDGKITADVIRKAFANAADDLDKSFGTTVPTIGQMVTILRNNFVKFLGELNASTGIFTAIGAVVGLLADNIGLLTKAATVFAAVWLGRVLPSLAVGAWSLLASGIAAVRAALVVATASAGLFSAAMAGPVIAGIALVVAAVIAARGPLERFGESLVETAGDTEANIKRLHPEVVRLSKSLEFLEKQQREGRLNRSKEIKQTKERLVVLRRELKINQETLGSRQAAQNQKARDAAEAKNFADLDAARTRLKIAQIKEENAAAEDAASRAAERARELRDSFKTLEEGVFPVKAAMNAYAETLEIVERATRAGLSTQENATQVMDNFAASLLLAVGPAVAGDAALSIDVLKRGIGGVEDQLLSGKIALEEYAKVMSNLGGLADRTGNSLAAIKTLKLADIDTGPGAVESVPLSAAPAASLGAALVNIEDQSRILAITREQRQIEAQIQAILRERPELIGAGEVQLRAALTTQQEALRAQREQDAAQQAQQAAQIQLASQFANSFVDAAFDANTAWGEFFGNMLENISKAIAKALILKAITAAIGGGNGAGASAIGQAFGFAHGGEFTVGGSGGTDSQLVAMRVTPGEHVIVQTPAQATAGPPGGAPSEQNVRVVVVSDAKEAALELLRSRAGERVILETMRRNPGAGRA